jgi:oligopeptide/dipeptide ABC transporter ATP-binding protein
MMEATITAPLTALELHEAPQELAAPADPRAVLRVAGLHTEFGRRDDPIRAVRGVSFELRRGETLVLLGESGSGKSVTARSLLGLYGPSARVTGSVVLDGQELVGLGERGLQQVRGSRIGLVPQDPSAALDPLRRIGAQIVEVLLRHRVITQRREGKAMARDLLAQVGLPDPARAARAFPHELSGGMRQRAVIAIALACGPDVLIADEPTTALDVTVQAQILELFQSLQRERVIATLLVTHDVGVADQVGDRIAVMYAGRIVETGPAAQVLDRPAHPYTAALLRSLPRPGIRRGELRPITGRALLAGERLEGCPFATRCERAVSACTAAEPVLVPVATSWHAACSAPDVIETWSAR